MKKLRLIWFCVSLGLLSSGCGAGRSETKPVEKGGQPASVRTSADVVRVEGSGVGLSSGNSAELPVLLSISPGYHINANPATFDYLIATELTADKSEGMTFGKPIYPRAQKRKFQFAPEALAVYEGNVQIRLPLQASSNAGKGPRTLSLNLRVQACDEEKCFPPDTLHAKPSVDVK
jgi:uncharacterized protein